MTEQLELDADSNGQPAIDTSTLADLANRINAEWRKAAGSIIETGRLLIEAKREVGPGNWLRFVEGLPFSDRTAQRLIEIASHPVLSDATHVSHLPPSWGTLHRLTAIPKRDLRVLLESGRINCESQRKDVDRLIRQRGGDGAFDGLFRIPDALNTLLPFVLQYPNPKEIAGRLCDCMDDLEQHHINLSDMAKVIDWLKTLHGACRWNPNERARRGRPRTEQQNSNEVRS